MLAGFFLFLLEWFVLLLLKPGGGAASSQNPPAPLLELVVELHGAVEFETRLGCLLPWWFCFGIDWGVAGFVMFGLAVATPTEAALLAHDKFELALPHTEA